MGAFKVLEKGVEVNGQTVLSVIHGMEFFEQKALKILEAQGIKDPEPGQWYCQQAWLNAFKIIADEIGPYALYCIGEKIPDNADFPEDMNTLHDQLLPFILAYHMNHRGGEIGSYEFYKVEDGEMYLTCKNPYPCEFDRGIIAGIAKQVTPGDHYSLVLHDDSGPCREKGDGSCTYLIKMVKR